MNNDPQRGARRLRRGLAAGAAAVLSAGILVGVAEPASAAPACRVTYQVNAWPGGFNVQSLNITNLGDPITGGWTVTFSYASGQTITQAWNSSFTQSGSNVTIRSAAWNGSIATNATVNPAPGWNGSQSGSTHAAPTSFSLNGTVCNGVPTPPPPNPPPPPAPNPPPPPPPGPNPPPPPPPAPNPPPPPPPAPNPPPPPPGTRVDNPYAGARLYVNPEWRAKANTVSGGSRISNTPTAVWIDRIAAIEGTPDSQSNGPMGVEDHLDAAVAQGATAIQFVIYNLPGRDCSALASNGELGVDELPRYKSAYIDPIAAIQALPKFANLRIINIVEIDSLPNLVTNTNIAKCQTMLQNRGYVDGIGYALAKFGAIPNVYNYIDAAHHGWIGWSSNFTPTANMMATAARASGSTVNNVHGFITNTANYSALTEPYITLDSTTRQSRWIDWNDYNDELSFAQAFRNQLVSVGFNSNIGMLIDTSRNGWGGSARPTGPSTASDVNTRVNESRIDRRIHKGNWCNQSGAGMGERPRSAPAAGIDAYVWVKPPGESDGSSREIPNTDGKGFDRMCDPTYGGNSLNGNNPTGALADAPISGAFFSAQFAQLMQNAYPALQ